MVAFRGETIGLGGHDLRTPVQVPLSTANVVNIEVAEFNTWGFPEMGVLQKPDGL